jgi:hypothetical protein
MKKVLKPARLQYGLLHTPSAWSRLLPLTPKEPGIAITKIIEGPFNFPGYHCL